MNKYFIYWSNQITFMKIYLYKHPPPQLCLNKKEVYHKHTKLNNTSGSPYEWAIRIKDQDQGHNHTKQRFIIYQNSPTQSNTGRKSKTYWYNFKHWGWVRNRVQSFKSVSLYIFSSVQWFFFFGRYSTWDNGKRQSKNFLLENVQIKFIKQRHLFQLAPEIR